MDEAQVFHFFFTYDYKGSKCYFDIVASSEIEAKERAALMSGADFVGKFVDQKEYEAKYRVQKL